MAVSPDATKSRSLPLIRAGLANADIANELYLSPRTVTTHVKSILRKLGATNRPPAAVLAERNGLTRAT